MPELPEVETVKRGIAPYMDGAIITSARFNRMDLRWPFPADIAQRLTGQAITGIRRRAKYILIDLASGEVVLIHLGMSGRILVSGEMAGAFTHDTGVLPQHNHVELELSSGVTLIFNDPRRFGAMDVFGHNAEADHFLIKTLGPEPLGNALSDAYLTERMAGRRTPMKSFLLDQRNVAGLGNIYVSEILWLCQISPRRLAGNVPKAKIPRLVPAIRDVLSDAIEAGGSSLRDYRQADGALGYFQHRFRAYDREGDACAHSGCTGTIRRIVQSARSTYYCPQCQR